MALTEKERNEKRMSILNAAKETIQEMSYDEITMEHIARKLSFSRPAIYQYFKNKSEIYLTLLADGLKQLRSGYDRSFSMGIEDPVGQFTAIAVSFFKFYSQNYHYFDLIVTKRAEMMREVSDEIKQEYEEASNNATMPIVDAYKKGVESKIFPEFDPEKIAYLLRAMGVGIAVGFREGDLVFPEDIEIIQEVMLHGLFGRESGAT